MMGAGTGSIWMIGDIQGCRVPLERLLAHPRIAGDPQARFWFAGDLVNRGPDSLGSLRTIMALGDRAVCVLGNHDLHLLAVAAGITTAKSSDTIGDILEAPDAEALIDWLRHRPMAHHAEGHLLVHAGVLPQWDVGKVLALAAEVEAALRSSEWKTHLGGMYGNKPAKWKERYTGDKRRRAIINALTRMRFCDPRGHMEFSAKGAPGKGGDLVPWFDLPDRAAAGAVIVFGHWSTLGLLVRDDVICLDTGCVWGRRLTAMRLHDRALIQVDCEGCGKASR